MVIKFIPKKEEKVSWKKKRQFYISLLLFLAVFISSVFLYYENQKLSKNFVQLKEEILKSKTPEEINLEKNVIAYKRKIDDFSTLLENHSFPSQFFKFLEDNTQSQIVFQSLNFDVPKNKVDLTGEADSFQTLQRQLLIFENSNFIKDVSLSDVGFIFSKNGKKKVGFSLSLILSNNLLKK